MIDGWCRSCAPRLHGKCVRLQSFICGDDIGLDERARWALERPHAISWLPTTEWIKLAGA